MVMVELGPSVRTCILTLCILPFHCSMSWFACARGSGGRPPSRDDGAGERLARVERERGTDEGGARDEMDALAAAALLRVDGGGDVGVDWRLLRRGLLGVALISIGAFVVRAGRCV